VVLVRNLRAAAYVVIACLCAGVAPATSAQTAMKGKVISDTTVLEVNVDSQLNSAVFDVKSDPSATVSVGIGTDPANLVVKTDARKSTVHRIVVKPLAPLTKYYYRVKAVKRGSRTLTNVGLFETGPVTPTTLSVVDGKFRLNGVRIFAVMEHALNQCPDPSVITANVQMGVSVMTTWGAFGNVCTDYENGRFSHSMTTDELDALLAHKLWWLDRNAKTPLTDLPEKLNVNGNLARSSGLGDLGGCYTDDATQLYTTLQAESSSAATEGSALIRGVLLTPRVAPSNSELRCLDGRGMTATFWTTVFTGAAGIEYTDQYINDMTAGSVVNQDVRLAAATAAKHLATLYPVVFGGQARAARSTSHSVKAWTWSWGGKMFVAALNLENKRTTAVLSPTGRCVGARVFWEGRSETCRQNDISDVWQPLQLHVYELNS
jgi:hypothetical protein